jgi:thymidylate synthase (FAD)
METEAKAQGFDFITPPSILENEEALSIYNTYMEETQATYDKLRELGILAEDARYMLPNAATTNITLTCNLRAFIDLYKKRNSSTHAQWEIAELVEKMKEIILEEESWISEII